MNRSLMSLASLMVLASLVTLGGCSSHEEGIRSVKRPDAAEAERIQLDQLALANKRLEDDIVALRNMPPNLVDCAPDAVRMTPQGRLQLPPGGPIPGLVPGQGSGPMSSPDATPGSPGAPGQSKGDGTSPLQVPGFRTEGLPDQPPQTPQPDQPGSAASGAAPSAGPSSSAPPPSAAASGATPPRDPSQLATMPPSQLTKKLEQATALIVTDKGTGTGFFINDKLIVTNRHVVENATEGSVFATSRALGSKRRVTVLRLTKSSTPGSSDFALLRIDDGTGPGFLGLGTQVGKLDPVVVAGYPGLAIRNDPEFARLMQGDGTAAPDLNFTQGAVQSLTEQPNHVSLIVHTASILKGNSGGPLVDMCGRVVGVNTFISIDEKQAGRLGYAQGADGLVAFLRDTAGAAEGDSRNCGQ